MNTMKRTEIVVVLCIMAVAVGFRLYGLDTTPPGLHPNEAMNGTDAVEAWESGEFRIFYPDNNGREGLFINLQAVSVHFLGNTPFALRLVSALVGILTVLGTYLLARRLFDNWELAAIAAFLMAVGFWHVNFSRIGFRAIMAPLCSVWALYYIYKGIETTRIWPWLAAGFWLGLGFHTYIAFRVMPAVVAVVIIAYLYALRRDFRHDAYAHIRHQLWGSMGLMVAVMIIILLPMATYFYANPGDLVGRTSQVSVFAGGHPARDIITNFGKTIGMFMFSGDTNWRHGIAGEPALFWPIGALFAVGLLRSIYKIFRTWRTHGHPSTVHVLLLSWLFIGILPAVLSKEGIPHALRALNVAPAVYIIAGQGVWWLYVWMLHWFQQRDTHRICLPGPNGHQWCAGEGQIVVGFALVVFLFAIGVGEAHRYFVRWATHPNVAAAFNGQYVRVAERLSMLSPAALKYVVVSPGDVTVDGVAVSAQTVMYLTDTGTPEKQKSKNISYLTPLQFERHAYPRGAFVIQLDP